MQQQKEVTLITDGACIGNPGPGGWACILRYGERTREIWGCEADSTNNRMELKAVIAGLSALTEPCFVHITTDSKYVQNGLTQWIENWKKNHWFRQAKGASGREPIKNRDLWERLDDLRNKHTVILEWVKGHADHVDNNRCDELATRAARGQLSSDD